MEQSNETKLSESDRHFWENPSNYALVSEKNEDEVYFSIYTLTPIFMMSLIDDLEYAKMLANKMIENGVKVFNNFSELVKWNNARQRS